MKTTVVCGLLGSGKTTFIKNRLQGSTEKTVVLVNDFGKAGIDGEIFSADGIESVELPSGCVCCTLKFDLITTITKIIKEFSPDHLVIEPSGVASPSGVLEALESAGIDRVSVVGIVDATEFTELYDSGMYGKFFEEQVSLSDVILVNKADLAQKEMMTETMNRIETINPRAILFKTVNAQLLAPLAQSIDEAATSHKLSGSPKSGFALLQNEPAHRLQFETLSFKLDRVVNLADFVKLFDDLAKGRFGQVARGKALIGSAAGSYRFDSVYGKVDQVPFGQDVKDSRLVVIGEGLNKAAIEKELSGRL